ncbi:MAG: hypothetical protein KDF95_18310, partial [Rhodocyclaceae bacterium]|nr:hypothetical protein [Rhodocyclaceae bacterium]
VHQVSGSCGPGQRFVAVWSSAPGGTRLVVDGLGASWSLAPGRGSRIDGAGALALTVGEQPVVLASETAEDWPRIEVVD